VSPRILPVLVVFVTALCVGACLSPARESELGDQQAERVEREMGLVGDAVPLAYVRALGKRLAAVSDRPEGPWSFEIADSPEPNAFALPGGHVYVTRGLLALVNSEDELAGVIGHEIGHVTARHSAKRISAGVLTAPVAIASGIASFGVGLVSPFLSDVVRGTGSLVTGGLVLAPYSRAQENEADEIGQGLAARAGYDPAGISSFMRSLKREGELRTKEGRRFHIMDTHPMPADRAKRTEQRARTLNRSPAAPVAKDAAALFGKLEGLLVGEDPAHGVFRERLFLHPGFDLAIEFPEGWKTANTPEAAGAVNPGKDAVVALHMAAADTSLDAVLEKAEQGQKGLDFERSTIRGLPAAHTRYSSGGQTAAITLIGYRGHVFSVAGQSAERAASALEPVFASTAGSFRALPSSERRAIRESRLRLRAARAGETPAALTERTGSTWSAEELALANGVDDDTRFRAGRRVKVAVSEPYSR